MSLISSGHDFVSVMSISLTRLFANYNTKDISEITIANNFILSYNFNNFSTSNMYTDFRSKEKKYNISMLK